MVETLRVSKVKTWRDVNEQQTIGASSPLEHFASLEDLEAFRLPDTVADRHLTEDQYAEYERQREAYQAQRGEDLADPAMFRSMTWRSQLRVVPGTKRVLWQDRAGEVWTKLDPIAADRIEKSDSLVRVPRRRGEKWEEDVFQKSFSGAKLIQEIGAANSPMGNRSVYSGAGQTMSRLEIDEWANRDRTPAPVNESYRAYLHHNPQAHHHRRLGPMEREKVMGTQEMVRGTWPIHPLNEGEYVEEYRKLVDSAIQDIPSARARIDAKAEEQARWVEETPLRPKEKEKPRRVTVRKSGLGEVSLRIGSYGFVVELPDRSERLFRSLSAASDHVWCLQKGYRDAVDYKTKHQTNKIPSGGGWKFWGVRTAA